MRTYYDLWLENEIKKIRDKFKAERDKLDEEAFLEGISADTYYIDVNAKKRAEERINRLKEIEQREQIEIDNFMKLIDQNWNKYVEGAVNKQNY